MRHLALSLLALGVLTADAFSQGIILERLIIEPPPRVPEPRAPWPIRLIEHRVDAKVEGQAAVFEVTQVFHNPNAWPGEGTYLFPLPEGASVSRFTMRMGDKDVTGELLDAERARDIYLSIVRRRDDPGLLEYAGRGLIRARLFPMPARGDTKVTLRFEQVLPAVGGLVELVYPLRGEAFAAGLVRIAGTIDVEADAGVATLYSPTHPLDVVRRSDTHVVASFEERSSRADRDLRVLYGFGRKDVDFHVASHKPAGEDGTFLLLLSPNAGKGAEVLPKDVVFVLDTSGSMGERGGGKMKQAKAALSYALGRLDPKDRFNVVAFATAPRPFREGTVAASEENVRAALAFVDGLEATGGTAIHDALVEALRIERAEGRVPIVLFLTDGEATVGPTETPVILSAVEGANAARARVFSFGVGDDVNATLLTSLAERTRANALFVAESENIELKASTLYDQVASPVLVDVTLRIDGAGIHDVHPRRLGDLFKGQQVAVVGRYATPGACAVTLTGKLGGKDVTLAYDARLADQPAREYLPRLWAVRHVGFLIDEIRAHGEKPELVQEVKRLGTRYGIVTPYTSFLVVEEEEMLRRRFDGRQGGAGGGGPAPEAALEALDDYKTRMGDAGEGLGGRKEAGKGAVAGARLALELRDAENDASAGIGVKTAGDKTFRLVDGVWIDTAIPAEGSVPGVRVAYLSDDYVALLADARLARYLSVGPKVQLLHQGRLYIIE